MYYADFLDGADSLAGMDNLGVATFKKTFKTPTVVNNPIIDASKPSMINPSVKNYILYGSIALVAFGLIYMLFIKKSKPSSGATPV